MAQIEGALAIPEVAAYELRAAALDQFVTTRMTDRLEVDIVGFVPLAEAD